MNIARKFISVLMLCTLLAACGDPPVNPGEVAKVNGRIITLKQMQAMHDQLVASGDSPGRSLGDMRREYGSVLMELIVYELVEQALEKRNLGVTEEELNAEKKRIQEDFYSADDFDRMMLEASFDVELWTESLRHRLALDKFMAKVLRPEISINSIEVENYYLTHEQQFTRPARIRFVQISSPVKEELSAASSQFLQVPDTSSVQKRFSNVIIHEVSLTPERIMPEQLAELEKLAPMQASPVMDINGENIIMVLIAREEPVPLNKQESYKIIEKMLLEHKNHEAFNAWLETTLEKSKINVSTHLLPEFVPDMRLFHMKVEPEWFGEKALKAVKNWW